MAHDAYIETGELPNVPQRPGWPLRPAEERRVTPGVHRALSLAVIALLAPCPVLVGQGLGLEDPFSFSLEDKVRLRSTCTEFLDLAPGHDSLKTYLYYTIAWIGYLPLTPWPAWQSMLQDLDQIEAGGGERAGPMLVRFSSVMTATYALCLTLNYIGGEYCGIAGSAALHDYLNNHVAWLERPGTEQWIEGNARIGWMPEDLDIFCTKWDLVAVVLLVSHWFLRALHGDGRIRLLQPGGQYGAAFERPGVAEFYSAHGEYLRDMLRDQTVRQFCLTFHDLYHGNIQVFRTYADQSNRPLPSVSLAELLELYQFLQEHTRDRVDDGELSPWQLMAVTLPPEVWDHILNTIPQQTHAGRVVASPLGTGITPTMEWTPRMHGMVSRRAQMNAAVADVFETAVPTKLQCVQVFGPDRDHPPPAFDVKDHFDANHCKVGVGATPEGGVYYDHTAPARDAAVNKRLVLTTDALHVPPYADRVGTRLSSDRMAHYYRRIRRRTHPHEYFAAPGLWTDRMRAAAVESSLKTLVRRVWSFMRKGFFTAEHEPPVEVD